MDVEDLYRLLRNDHMQAQAIVDHIDMPVAVLDQQFCILNVNHSFCSTFKSEREDTIGESLFTLGSGQWDVAALKQLLAEVIPKAAAVIGYEITGDFPHLGQRTMLVSARRIRAPRGMEIMVQFEDVTQRKRTEEAHEILLAEMHHRSCNLLAFARALASHTETEGRSAAEYRDTFLNRFEALLAAQDLSTESESDFAALVSRVLRPLDEARVFLLPGPPAPLSPPQVLPLAMVLHELMTNAVKYGALSTKRGVVHVTWTIDTTPEATVLIIDWREEGGRKVTPPSRQGFGSRLIAYSSKELRGTIALRFEPKGLHATLRLPLTSGASGRATAAPRQSPTSASTISIIPDGRADPQQGHASHADDSDRRRSLA